MFITVTYLKRNKRDKATIWKLRGLSSQVRQERRGAPMIFSAVLTALVPCGHFQSAALHAPPAHTGKQLVRVLSVVPLKMLRLGCGAENVSISNCVACVATADLVCPSARSISDTWLSGDAPPPHWCLGRPWGSRGLQSGICLSVCLSIYPSIYQQSHISWASIYLSMHLFRLGDFGPEENHIFFSLNSIFDSNFNFFW